MRAHSSYRSLVTIPLSDEIVSDTRPYSYGRIVADDRVIEQPEGEEIQLPVGRDRIATAKARSNANASSRSSSSSTTEPLRRNS